MARGTSGCTVCGRDNDHGTHAALEATGHLSHHYQPAPKLEEGSEVLLKVRIARTNSEQSFIEFLSMEGPYSIRVPNSELVGTSSKT